MAENLYQKDDSKLYYEHRYEKGYMDDWPEDKLNRVLEVIRLLDLPETGTALDFGCGQGVVTEILRLALPKWTIYGSDLSDQAIEKAKARFPLCHFYDPSNTNQSNQKYDLIFTHHVLEHVYNLDETLEEIDKLLKPQSCILHILPCGNKNSFEYNLCKRRIDGLNPNMENRFFYEDPGHVRRMTSKELIEATEKYGFKISDSFFCNHFFGAIKWISRSQPKLIKKLTDPNKAKNNKYKFYFKFIRLFIKSLYKLQFGIMRIKGGTDWKGFVRPRNDKNLIIKYLAWLYDRMYYAYSTPIYQLVNILDKLEWRLKKKKNNGSEMFLFFKR